MDRVLDFYNFDENKIKSLIQNIFKNENWVEKFLNDSHHGFTHGNQVKQSCLKLVENLNENEKRKLVDEGRRISEEHFYEYSLVAIIISAIFHDCGRFNNNGEIIVKEQKLHHILSTKRAKKFCETLGLSILIPYIEDAILSHDFQSNKLTPNLKSPKTIIGKIIQSSDQMGWFHPDSLNRTLNYNKALGLPFYDNNTTLKEIQEWMPGKISKDALTVMLNQLFGPTGIERFAIEYARKKVELYKLELEENILNIANNYNVKESVKKLIQNFKNK